jgi:hypothetical protein
MYKEVGLMSGHMAWRLILLLLAFTAVPAWAAGGGGEAIVFVADSRGLPEWLAWWTNLYNESRLYFSAATVIIIPMTGLLLSILTDRLMARIGINLKSRVLAEH